MGKWCCMYIHEFDDSPEHAAENATHDETPPRDDFSAEERVILTQHT